MKMQSARSNSIVAIHLLMVVKDWNYWASGSGKSTLINLLSGFLLPTEETSQLAINGQTIPHFLQKDWQKQILYIPQAPYIFQDTLANNIRFLYT